MPPAILKAHYDGEHIILDEPFDLPPDVRLLVTILPADVERANWVALSTHHLGRAYGDEEPEYTAANLQPQ